MPRVSYGDRGSSLCSHGCNRGGLGGITGMNPNMSYSWDINVPMEADNQVMNCMCMSSL